MPRALYIPVGEDDWLTLYNEEQQQIGSGFSGVPYQRGYGLGGLLGGLFRSILPMAKSALKTVGKEALRTGVGIASDVLAGEKLETSAKERARAAGQSLLKRAHDRLQSGEGVRKKRRQRQQGRGLGYRRPMEAIKHMAARKKKDIFTEEDGETD